MSAPSNLDIRALRANKNIPARNYWRNRLQGFEWETSFAGGSVQVPRYGSITVAIPASIIAKLQALAEPARAQHIVLLGALGIFMNKYTSASDLVIFTPIYRSETGDTDNNIFPIRFDHWDGLRFRDFLDTLRSNFLQDLAHANYPVHKIVNREKEELARQPLTGIVLEEVQEIKAFESFSTDLLFSFSGTDEPTLTIRYNNHSFDNEEIVNMTRLYVDLLGRLIDNREEDIAQLSLLSKEEENNILYTLNDTFFAYPEGETVIDLWEQQAATHPDNIALWSEGACITYAAMSQLAGNMAHYLQQKGIRQGELVGLLLDREKMLLPCILAILQSGAAYVPLDPANPPGRIQAIIKDAGIKVLVTREKHLALIEQHPAATVINLDHELPDIQNQPVVDCIIRPSPHDLAYIIYTSGSTGIPNGVQVNHSSLANYIRWAAQQYVGREMTGFALYSSVAFDLTVTSLFVPLATGNAIYVFQDTTGHHLLIEEVIAADRAEVVKLTPAHLRIIRDSDLLKDHCPIKLRTFIVGGEQLDTKLAKDIHDKYQGRVVIFNEYGPTEATVGCMIYRFNPTDTSLSVPIGIPIHNTKIYLLDALLRPVAPGVQGEIYIGGKGLAGGYLHRETLTQQKFIDNPYYAGEKMYKTGDLAMRIPGGAVLYKGRVDEQVKINGYRVELGEIGSLLKKHEGIEEAVVVLKENQEGKYPVAYYTASQTILPAQLQDFLRDKVPAYMMPAWFVQLESIPLTFNGKLNRKALPDPGELADTVFVAPRTAEEQLLAATWSQVLGSENVGVTSNFFSLGGDSIKSIQVISRIRSAGYEITIDDIFSLKTVEALAAKLKAGGMNNLANGKQSGSQHIAGTIRPVGIQPHYPLSAAQGRLWVLSQWEEGRSAYNMRSVYVFEGRLNIAALEQAFSSLIMRHESLRTTFKAGERGEIRQYILAPEAAGFQLEFVDARHETGEWVSARVQRSISRPFDLAEGPLLRAELYQVADDKWIFSYVMHHIISDGWSLQVLIKELLLLYNAYADGEDTPLKPLTIQYKDFTAWQQEQLNEERLTAHKQYWLNHLGGGLPILKLPVDKLRPPAKTYKGATIERTIPVATARGIKKLGEEQGCTLFMSLLAAVNVLLYKYTGQEDIILGTPVAGRDHQELEDQIGFYLNTLALRTRFSGEESFLELLRQVKQITLGAYQHQDYPFDLLLGEIELPAHSSHSALFDVMVALQNTNASPLGQPEDLSHLTVTRYEEAGNRVSIFDLTFDFNGSGDELILSLEYSTDLFYPETAMLIATQLEQLLVAITGQPTVPVRTLECPGIADKKHLPKAGNKTDLINDLEL